MAKFAAGFCCLLGGRIIRLRSVYTAVVYVYYLLVGKSLLRKRRDYVAQVSTVNLFDYGIVRNFLDIGVALTAGDILVNRIGVNLLVHIIVDSFASLIDSSKEAIFMAHETIVFVRCFSLQTNGQGDEYHHEQYSACPDDSK